MLIKTVSDIGSLIKRLRGQESMSGSRFAAKVDIEQPTVSRLENGRINVTLKTLIRIATRLGKSLYVEIR